MIDETQGKRDEKPTAAEDDSSGGGASEWSTVPRSPYTSSEPASPVPATAASSVPVTPSPELPLEPLPKAPVAAAGQAGHGPSVDPNAPSSGPAETAGSGAGREAGPAYGAVYGTGSTGAAQHGYASEPGGGYPPPPTGYGGPRYPPAGGAYPPPGGPMPTGQGLSSNAAAAISYITFIPAVVFLVTAPYNRDRFIRFHAWQCIALTVVSVGIGMLVSMLSVFGLHSMFWILHLMNGLIHLTLFVAWLIALIKASQGQWYRIPIVGDLAQSFAGREG